MKRYPLLILSLSAFTLACGSLSSLARDASCEKFGDRAAGLSEMAGTYTRDDGVPKPLMTLSADGVFDIQNSGCLSGAGKFALDNNQFVLKYDVSNAACVAARLPLLTVCEIPGGALTIMQEDPADPDAWDVWARTP